MSKHPIPQRLRDVFSSIEDGATATNGMQVFTQMRTAVQSYFEALSSAQPAPTPAPMQEHAGPNDKEILALAANPICCPCPPWWLKDDVKAANVRQGAIAFARALLSRHGAQPAASVKPLFWYRPRSDSLYEGPIHNASIERVRKESSGWVPLFPGAAPVAAQAHAELVSNADKLPRLANDVRAALLYALWHHQGGSSPVGQPIRRILGIEQHSHLSKKQYAEVHRVQEALGFRVEAAQPSAHDAVDAARYRILRRGQHWSVVNALIPTSPS